MQHYEGSLELDASFGYQPPDRGCEYPASGGWESDQDHAWRIHARREDQPAEVFVFRQQQPILRECEFLNFLVRGTLLSPISTMTMNSDNALLPPTIQLGYLPDEMCEEYQARKDGMG